MCKTTTGTQTAATPDTVRIARRPTRPAFPLQAYLERAYAVAVSSGKLGTQPPDDSLAKLHVPIAFFAHVTSGDAHHFAGVHADEMHFSASLLKVAAMYSAFALRHEARAIADSGTFSGPVPFFAALSAQFSSNDAVPAIRNAGPAVGLKPKYTEVLQATGFGSGTPAVNFTSGSTGFTEHMRKMIVPSDNNSAAECIRRLGYAYINVQLMKGGFYSAATGKGIWLAADFAGGVRVEVDSENDAKAAQVTTAREIARMFSGIRLGSLLGASSAEMQALLAQAHGTDAAWISRNGPRRFDFEGVKVGLANLKPNTPPKGPDVYSEGLLLKWKGDAAKLAALNLTGTIAACWQNLRVSAFDTGTVAIAESIEEAFSAFLDQTPP